MYSVKAVSQATGISPETLRAWERRYGAVTPSREANGRRTYGADEVTRLRKLKRLSEMGHTIGRLARMSASELDDLYAQSSRDGAARSSAVVVDRLLATVDEYDEAGCDNLLAQALCVLPPQRLVAEVLGPTLIAVGERWHDGSVSVAQEHMLSTRIRRLVMSVMNTYCWREPATRLTFATHTGEDHTIGSLLAAFIAASLGARVHYLDSALPPSELDLFVRQVKANAAAVSLISLLDRNQACNQLEELLSLSNGAYEVWVGGAGAAELARDNALPKHCQFMDGTTDLDSRLRLPAA